VNHSHRSPDGNRHMRRLLNQSANAAARSKGEHLRYCVSPLGRAPGDIIRPLERLPIDSVD